METKGANDTVHIMISVYQEQSGYAKCPSDMTYMSYNGNLYFRLSLTRTSDIAKGKYNHKQFTW